MFRLNPANTICCRDSQKLTGTRSTWRRTKRWLMTKERFTYRELALTKFKILRKLIQLSEINMKQILQTFIWGNLKQHLESFQMHTSWWTKVSIVTIEGCVRIQELINSQLPSAQKRKFHLYKLPISLKHWERLVFSPKILSSLPQIYRNFLQLA